VARQLRGSHTYENGCDKNGAHRSRGAGPFCGACDPSGRKGETGRGGRDGTERLRAREGVPNNLAAKQDWYPFFSPFPSHSFVSTWWKQLGLPETHRRVFKALGVRKLHQSVLRTATPAIAGMLLKVKECVEVRVVDKTQLPTAREAQLRKKHAKRAEQAKVVEDTKVEIAKLVEQARPAIKKGKIGTVAAALSKVTPKRST